MTTNGNDRLSFGSLSNYLNLNLFPKTQKTEQTETRNPMATEGNFSTDLFDCFSDPVLCLLTCLFPCITFGRIAEIVDKGSPSCGVSGALYGVITSFTLCWCQWVYPCIYRSKLKAQYGMEDNPLEDACIHFWCERCALCQEYRELQHRGYDVALGWAGNMARQNPGIMMAPQIGGGMMR